MRWLVLALFLSTGLIIGVAAFAQTGGCVASNIGSLFCAPPNGGVARSGMGVVVCGPGQRVTDGMGIVKCSSRPGGSAGVDGMGIAKCTDGCVAGRTELCQRPR
jgi:hypothetical protein